jgi:hypothetical protein
LSWPIGYYRGTSTLEIREDGSLFASGTRVTTAGGWLELPSPRVAIARGAPASIMVQLRAVSDATGRPFLYAERVAVDRRRFRSVFEFLTGEGEAWALSINHAVYAELERRALVARLPVRRTESGTSRIDTRAPPVAVDDDVGSSADRLRQTSGERR